MKYRKKPIVIEAVQWLNKKIVCPPGPEWFADAEERGVIQLAGDTLHILTLEGDMAASPGDWIIRGVKGELYPCKPDIFSATYEPANETSNATAPTPADLAEAAKVIREYAMLFVTFTGDIPPPFEQRKAGIHKASYLEALASRLEGKQ